LRRRYFTGADARSFGVIAGLPAGLRERAVAGAFDLPRRQGSVGASSVSV
jgi:hypothetical protein